jgi:hypothetical protein
MEGQTLILNLKTTAPWGWQSWYISSIQKIYLQTK